MKEPAAAVAVAAAESKEVEERIEVSLSESKTGHTLNGHRQMWRGFPVGSLTYLLRFASGCCFSPFAMAFSRILWEREFGNMKLKWTFASWLRNLVNAYFSSTSRSSSISSSWSKVLINAS